MRILGLLFGVLFSLPSTALPPNVFGDDDRREVTSSEFPWSAIGYLSTGCTGTLVGPDLVLTAAHCVLEDNGSISSSLDYFYPNLVAYQPRYRGFIEHVWWGTNRPNEFRQHDWAILKLRERLGDELGWMGVRTALPDRLSLGAYSGDFRAGGTPALHEICQIRDIDGDLLLHDCDSSRGSSGGPMFQVEGDKVYLVALNVGEYRGESLQSLSRLRYEREHANIALPTTAFLPKLMELLR